MATEKFIAYYRVSTDRQGKSGLGLEAQSTAVMDWLNGGSWELIEEYTEIESGNRNDRPQLIKALEACKRQKATLIIAKLDRLARNVAFVANLMESGVEFLAVDMPQANKLTVHIMAAMAEHEREMISQRTKAALQAAKERGTKLGWSIPSRKKEQRQATLKANQANREHASRFATNVLPIVREIEKAGITTLKGMAEALNARGVHTARGGKWYPTTVKNLIGRELAA